MNQSDNTSTPHRDRFIKVCGNCNEENLRQVSALTPMMMGFIFSDKSPRCATGLDPEIVKSLPEYIIPVGVFLNADEETIKTTAGKFGISHLQLHGNESPELCDRLRKNGLKIFKTIHVGESLPVEMIERYAGCVDMFVFDTLTEKAGGSGRKFDWNLLENYNAEVPYLIGGGVSPDDIDNIVAAMRPHMVGIDINSRFEISPGIKDIRLLTHFILSLRKFNEDEPSYITF